MMQRTRVWGVEPTRTPLAASPRFDPAALETASAFVAHAGLILDEIGTRRVVGHIDLDASHHTPWGIVHGGVYATAIETAASVGASAAVVEQSQVAVGLTNTTHFLRALSSGRVRVDAEAIYQGRTHQLWRADITDPSGRLVSHGEVRLQNVAGGPSGQK
jgi:1,4-dihydroxy-2-naphthoyl-CoA hydrolase